MDDQKEKKDLTLVEQIKEDIKAFKTRQEQIKAEFNELSGAIGYSEGLLKEIIKLESKSVSKEDDSNGKED